MTINIYNQDCMIAMRSMKDREYDLAICDPMYDLPDNYLCPGTEKSVTCVKRNFISDARKLAKQEVVGEEYFSELKRVSKNQIVWGEQYFAYPGKPVGRIIWDKINDTSTFSNAELASCSLIKGVRIFRYLWNGMIQQDMKNKERRIHPFQKPVALYQWLLKNYAKQGDKILDTHGGSCSSAIACDIMGFDADIFEIDLDYYTAAVKRFEAHKKQTVLFGADGLPAKHDQHPYDKGGKVPVSLNGDLLI